MLKGFRDFIMRGNLVQIAVAFVIATAFATVVIAFVGFIMSIVSKLAGGPPNLNNMHPGGILIGPVITAFIAFLIIAAVVYFLVVVPYNRYQARLHALGQDLPPTQDIALLQEIRDLLAARNRAGTGV